MRKGLLETGFKILVAVMSGVAIFVAMGKGNNGGGEQRPQARPQPQPNPQPNFQVQGQQQNVELSKGESILHGLRVGQDTCAKVSGFFQSLGGVTSSVMSIFSDKPAPTNYYQQQPYGYGGNYIGDNMWRPNDFMIMPGPRNSGYGRSYYDEANGRNPF